MPVEGFSNIDPMPQMHHEDAIQKLSPQEQKINKAVSGKIKRDPIDVTKSLKKPVIPAGSGKIAKVEVPLGSVENRYQSKTLEAQKMELYDLLDIRLPPGKENQAEFTEKQKFLDAHVGTDSAARICEQAGKHPIMQNAISQLNSSFEIWDGTSQDRSITKQISIQIKNINHLSKLMAGLSMENKGLASKKANTKNMAFLEPFLKGKTEFSEHDLRQVKSMLTKLEDRSEATGEKKPISQSLIEAESELFQAEREGLQSASKQKKLVNANVSANEVTFLESPSGEKIAVYKEARGGEQASGIMEELFWQLGQITGDHELLVATKRSRMRTESEMAPGAAANKIVLSQDHEGLDEDALRKKINQEILAKKGVVWTGSGEGTYRNDLGEARRGGIQKFQKGMTLKNWRAEAGEKPAIDRQSTLDLAHFAVKMGTFDLHHSNIYCTPEGKFKLFDNTRSLPNSNLIFHHHELLVPCRIDIYDLEGMTTPLTPQERAALKEKVAKDRQDLKDLANFLNSKTVASRLDQLPENWFDTEQVLAAMEERVSLMEQAIDNPKVQTMTDFVLHSQPNLKFAAALQILTNSPKALAQHYSGNSADLNKEKSDLFTNAGFDSITSLINKAAEQGYDPAAIKEIAENPDLSFDEVIDHLAALQNANQYPVANQYKLNALKLNLELMQDGTIDCKDCTPESAESNANAYSKAIDDLEQKIAYESKPVHEHRFDSLSQKLTSLHCPKFPFAEGKAHLEKAPAPYFCVLYTNDVPPKATFYHKAPDGYTQTGAVDYMSNPSKILVNGKSMDDFLFEFDPLNLYPDVKNKAEANSLLKMNTWLLGTNAQGSLTVYFNNEGNKYAMDLVPNEFDPEVFEFNDIFNDDEPTQMTLAELNDYLENLNISPLER